jgi:hypothetical protein
MTTYRNTKTVTIEGRRFVVSFDDANVKPMIIKERKLHAPGTYMECWYNAPYWHHAHHPQTEFITRILAVAATL